MSGVYSLYDDGWRSKIVLGVGETPDRDAPVEVQYVSYDRFRGEYPAIARFDADDPALIRIAVQGFNELDEQVYIGRCHPGPPAMIAGVTHWRRQPFGFFAHRACPLGIGQWTDRVATTADFAGSFTLHCPGLRADLALWSAGPGKLGGSIRVPASEVRDASSDCQHETRISGSVNRRLPHVAQLVLFDVEPPVTFKLYLFSHSFTGMAAWVEQGERRMGCYLTRYRWGPPLRAGGETC